MFTLKKEYNNVSFSDSKVFKANEKYSKTNLKGVNNDTIKKYFVEEKQSAKQGAKKNNKAGGDEWD